MKPEALVKLKKPDLYEHDLPQARFELYASKPIIGIDTETRGLLVHRDRLCLIQLCDEDGVVSLVKYHGREAPLLTRLLEDQGVIKLFHFARFDIAVLKHYLGACIQPIWCTKIASKLVRTYTDRHGLKDLSREILALEMDKGEQMSDWAREDFSSAQLEYAANDVRVLIPIYVKMKALLERENRLKLAEKLFACLPVVAELDLGGWKDIFEH